jgi:hypothetical protein
LEEAPENGKEWSHSAHANGMIYRINLSALSFADTAGEWFHGANMVRKISSHTANNIRSDLHVLI